METTRVPAIIIGGGVIGTDIARELSEVIDGLFLLEQNPNLHSDNQSSHSSGVVHAGIYYPKSVSPLKARLCVQGNELLYSYAASRGVPIKKVGKLVVFTDSIEEEYADDVLRIGRENGVPGIEKITIEQARKMEPNIGGMGAIYVPTSGIVDAVALTYALAHDAERNGVTIVPGNKVIGIVPKHSGSESGFEITCETRDGQTNHFEAGIVVNAAGLYADEIARMFNPKSPYKIIPTRGESAKFYDTRRAEIVINGMNIYPAPYVYDAISGERMRVSLADARNLVAIGLAYSTVGVHLTPTFDERGEISNVVTIGPAKTVGVEKGDYASNLRGPEYYHRSVRNIFPGLREDDIELHQAGIMAVLKGHSDWVIERDPRFRNLINLIGLDTPALTASLAIGKYVRSMW